MDMEPKSVALLVLVTLKIILLTLFMLELDLRASEDTLGPITAS